MKLIRKDNLLRFYCPGCELKHTLNDTWNFNNDYEKPTITPSIKVVGYNNEENMYYVCHLYITDGNIIYLSDCTHNLLGQTIPMVECESWDLWEKNNDL